MSSYFRTLLILLWTLINFFSLVETQFWQRENHNNDDNKWLPSNFYSLNNHQYLIYYQRGDIYNLKNYVFESTKYD